jgi:hypothetical protein
LIHGDESDVDKRCDAKPRVSAAGSHRQCGLSRPAIQPKSQARPARLHLRSAPARTIRRICPGRGSGRCGPCCPCR